jgi:hypothetical protein
MVSILYVKALEVREAAGYLLWVGDELPNVVSGAV